MARPKYQWDVPATSDEVIKSVGKKLKYYIDIKRKEDGFDLSSAYHPRMIHPAIKKRMIVMHDGPRQFPCSMASLKKNFADAEIRKRLTYLSLEPSNTKLKSMKTKRSKSVENNIEKTMENTVVREYFVPHGYCKRDKFGNVIVVNRFSDLNYGCDYNHARKSPFPGGIPTIRASQNSYVSQLEAERIVKTASKIIACSELTSSEKNELIEHRLVAAGVKKSPKRPKNRDNVFVTSEMATLASYDVYIQTGNENGASTEANVFIILFGTNGRSRKTVLTSKGGYNTSFLKGGSHKFEITLPHVGKITHVKIGMESDKIKDSWYLENAIVHDLDSDDVMLFECRKYLRTPHNSWIDMKPKLLSLEDLPDYKRPVLAGQSDSDTSTEDSSSSSSFNSEGNTLKITQLNIDNFFDAVRRDDGSELMRFLKAKNYKDFLKLQNKQGLKAIHVAATEGSIDALKRLAGNDAKIDEKSSSKYTALHYAAANKHANTVECLLSLGANVLEVTPSQSTILHLAAKTGSVAYVQEVLQVIRRYKGLNALQMRDLQGARPADVARHEGYRDVEQIFEHEAASNSVIASYGDEDDMETMTQRTGRSTVRTLTTVTSTQSTQSAGISARVTSKKNTKNSPTSDNDDFY